MSSVTSEEAGHVLGTAHAYLKPQMNIGPSTVLPETMEHVVPKVQSTGMQKNRHWAITGSHCLADRLPHAKYDLDSALQYVPGDRHFCGLTRFGPLDFARIGIISCTKQCMLHTQQLLWVLSVCRGQGKC